ncbi:MAG: KRRI-Interacting protein 1 [Geoglossum umbratile]|nr:MAG: KRRI-Interacting protein 1 [Geoglossum umbratile]
MKVKKTNLLREKLPADSGVAEAKQKTNGEPPVKRAKLLSGDSGGETSASEAEEWSFKINEEFVKRFEHNKKREELQRRESSSLRFREYPLIAFEVEEKYGKSSVAHKRGSDDAESEGSNVPNSEESSDSEEGDDDDEGALVTEALDAEISATLRAIRTKDPRVYDKQSKFYTEPEEGEGDGSVISEAERPMFLKDYHRKNFLEGYLGQEEDKEGRDIPRTYAQGQEDLKKAVVREIHDAVGGDEGDSDNDGGFLVSRQKSKADSRERTADGKPKGTIEMDVAIADQDPELFLSNFMASRAWIPAASSQFQPFESDDEEEDRRADEFEQAYNLRFEDPEGSNEKLMTHSRKAAAKYSFRREEVSGRKKAREVQGQKKEDERRQREEEKARLRKLKIEEMEEKVKKIKEAAGLRGKAISDSDWVKFLEDGWDNDCWDQEMSARFGDAYYAQGEEIDGEQSDGYGKKRKLKKPKWDDDIDIRDLIPDFEDEEVATRSVFTLSDGDNGDGAESYNHANEKRQRSPGGSKKERLRERAERKKEARQERKRIEQFVDDKLDFNREPSVSSSSKLQTRFRYRETSPGTFGLTPLDILMASDSQLNQFAGLKKLAAFRDPERKRKDKKKLGKKARLRQWRKETFGDDNGPTVQEPEAIVKGESRGHENPRSENGVDASEGHKGRKRSRKGKGKGRAAEA